jgi:hypothetical protein
MAFREVVEIFIDTKVESAKSQLSGLRQSISQAEGATGKLKAAASGVGSAISGVLSSPAGLAAAGTAIVGVAAKAVGAFQDLGVAVGKFSAATGTTEEEASRLVEVFSDLGVSPETAASSIARMSKTLDTNSDALAKYGIEAVKAADGTTDVNETFIAAVDAISKIKDPTTQAAAAQATFGKSWQSMAEIITGGAPALRKSLDSVGDAKVLSKADVKSARELRDALDSLKDAGEGLAISLGKSLAPAIVDVVEALGPLLTGLEKLNDLRNIEIDMPFDMKGIQPFLGALSLVQDSWGLLIDQVGKTPDLKGNFELAATGAEAAGVAAEAAAEDVKRFADTQKDLEKWVNNALDALKEQADQLAEQAGAYTTAADDQIAYNESLAEFAEVNTDATSTLKNIRDSAIDAAKSHVALYESLVDTTGAAATATGKIDAQNDSLLDTANRAAPKAKQAIYDYIFQVNDIPAEKRTAIIAAIEAGDLAEAKRLLDEASAPREAALVADATDAALAKTNADLDAAAHDRTVQFNAQAVGLAALTGAFNSAIRAAGGTTVGPTTVNITMPRGANGREIDAALARHARVNGRITALRRP